MDIVAENDAIVNGSAVDQLRRQFILLQDNDGTPSKGSSTGNESEGKDGSLEERSATSTAPIALKNLRLVRSKTRVCTIDISLRSS